MGESAKKRKRSDEEGSPRKRVTIAAENIRFTAVQNVGEWGPVLVLTPGLNWKSETSMDAYIRSRVNPSHHANGEVLLHSANHPKLDFVAAEEIAGDAQSLLDHYIAIHDPESGSTKVIPARKLVLRSTLQSARQPEESDRKTAYKTAMESRISLGQAFGTKKSQKALRSLTDNAIVSPEKVRMDSKGRLILEDAAAVVVDAMGETSILPTKEALQDAIDEAKPRPKANLAAETPSEVYLLEDLAGKDILVRLNTKFIQDAMKKKQDIPTYSQYFSNRVHKVAAAGDNNRLRALRLLLALVEWRKTFIAARRDKWTLAKDEALKNNVTSYDAVLMAKIKNKFVLESSLSQWDMDNIYTHICALALIVDNFVTDVFDLRHDLGIERQRITQLFREIGCRIVPPKESDFKDLGIRRKEEANNHALAKLRIPLTFPKMRTAMRRR